MLRRTGTLALAVVFLMPLSFLTGCATDDPEYNAFYHKGWLWPRSMDKEREIQGSGVRETIKTPTSF